MSTETRKKHSCDIEKFSNSIKERDIQPEHVKTTQKQQQAQQTVHKGTLMQEQTGKSVSVKFCSFFCFSRFFPTLSRLHRKIHSHYNLRQFLETFSS
jgi:hypothetical protein